MTPKEGDVNDRLMTKTTNLEKKFDITPVSVWQSIDLVNCTPWKQEKMGGHHYGRVLNLNLY